MRKKIPSLILAALILFSLSACSGNTDNAPNKPDNNPPSSAVTSTPTQTPEPVPSYYFDEIVVVEPKQYKDGGKDIKVESKNIEYFGEITVGNRSNVEDESNNIEGTYALFVTDGSSTQINFSYTTYGYYKSYSLEGNASGDTVVFARNAFYTQYMAEGPSNSGANSSENVNGLGLVRAFWSERKGGDGPSFEMLVAVISEDEAVKYATDGTLPKCLQGLTVTGLDEIFKKPNYEPGALDEQEAPATDFEYTTADDGVTITKYIGNRSKVVVPANIDGVPVTVIGSEAFGNRRNNNELLTHVTISNEVQEIGGSAFQNCTSLVSVELPDNLTTIQQDAFKGCTSLASLTLPSNLTTFGYSAFSGCISLSNVTIPGGVTSLDYVFQDCSALVTVTIQDGVTSIGAYAFSRCTELTNISIPNSVTVIGKQAFDDCKSLVTVEIPGSVTEIGSFAFTGTSIDKATQDKILSISAGGIGKLSDGTIR